MAQERITWTSRIGFVLASAGAAVGLGAIWKFPYMAGTNGGSVFMLPYIFFTLTVGVALLLRWLYVVWPNTLTAVLTPVSASPWEWGKALYWPVLAALLLLRGDIAEHGEIGVAAELRVQTVCTLHDDNGGCGDLRRGAVVHHTAIEAAVAKGPPLPQKRQNLLCKAFRMDIPAGGGKTLRRS